MMMMMMMMMIVVVFGFQFTDFSPSAIEYMNQDSQGGQPIIPEVLVHRVPVPSNDALGT